MGLKIWEVVIGVSGYGAKHYYLEAKNATEAMNLAFARYSGPEPIHHVGISLKAEAEN